MSVTLAEVAAELYALPPGDFTAARNARAKQVRAGGDRELATRVQALRRPTVAAWVVNALVRHHPGDVVDLLGLGAQLLSAQDARDGARLRSLDADQRSLMAVARGHGAALAADVGLGLTDTIAVQVEGTLRAAMTDPSAAEAVRSGLLTADLQSSGFGPVEVGDAVAVPGAPALLRAPDPVAPSPGGAVRSGPDRVNARRQAREEREREARRARRAAAEGDVARAQGRADEAERILRAAEAAEEDLARRHAELSAEVESLTAQLHRAQDRLTAVERDERRAATAREAAERAAEGAALEASDARRHLDTLDERD